MASSSNMRFHQRASSSSFQNHHMVSFQSGRLAMTPGNTFAVSGIGETSSGQSNWGGNAFARSTGETSSGQSNWGGNAFARSTGETSSSNLIVGAVRGLKWNPGLSQDWSIEEDFILNEGLIRFVDEPNIVKYIKIAHMLQDKNVRDVALRCLWMSKKANVKRRRLENRSSGKKSKDSKGKMVNCSADENINVPPSYNINAYSQVTPTEANPPTSVLDATIQHLLDQNCQLLEQISSNLETMQIENNVDLFIYARNNLIAIEDRMNNMPSIMNAMPPLTHSINEELVKCLFPDNK